MDRASKPGPSRMSDEDLLAQHGIDKECRVVISPVLEESLSEVCLPSEGNEAGPSNESGQPNKEFRVHYGRHFLWQLAEELAFRYEVPRIDMDRVYNTFIPSRFASMDRASFKSILQAYCRWWEKEFRKRRNELYEKALQTWKDKLERNRLVKLTYHNEQILCRKWNKEETKIAWKQGARSRVVLERLFVADTPVSASSFDPQLAGGQSGATLASVDVAPMSVDTAPASVDTAPSPADTAPASVDTALSSVDTAPASVDTAMVDVEDSRELPGPSTSRGASSSAVDTEVPLYFRYVGDESVDDRWTAINGAIVDMMAKVSEEQDPGDVASNQDMSSTDCYSEDTVESPMEVEFESGESPGFSKVLRDSDETCHGDEFFDVAGVGQQGLPHDNAGSSDVIQGTSARSPDKSMKSTNTKL